MEYTVQIELQGSVDNDVPLNVGELRSMLSEYESDVPVYFSVNGQDWGVTDVAAYSYERDYSIE